MLSCRHTSDARPLRPLILQLVESQLDSWMAEFHTLLTYENAALDEADAEKESSLDAVKSAACQVRRASAAARHVCGVGGRGAPPSLDARVALLRSEGWTWLLPGLLRRA